MTTDIADAMRRAGLCTRAQNVVEATRIIQQALSGVAAPDASDVASPGPGLSGARPGPAPGLSGYDARMGQPPGEADAPVASPPARTAGVAPLQRLRRPLGEVLRILQKLRLRPGASGSSPSIEAPVTPPPLPAGAQFLERSFTCAAGTRSYKLYVPASTPAPRGLVVMLHGCKQDPDDFAAGTNMNAIAEAHGLLVAYPRQPVSANPSGCWNWFSPADQSRGAGEPAIIAGLTGEITSRYRLDRRKVFVAGLSAGGAMAAVMAETYPDLYAAVGIHSGLPFGAANDVVSAFAAMRGQVRPALRGASNNVAATLPKVRTIVFHGTADTIVHPSNADLIVTSAGLQPAGGPPRREAGLSSGGRNLTRTIIGNADEARAIEYWLIEGAGHAWSGGRPAGSYTDSMGPDASAEMVRFFLGRPAANDPG